MKQLQCSVVVLSILIVGVSMIGTLSAAERGDYEVYIVNPAINNLAIRPHKPLPAVCQVGSKMEIMACRGEYEPASFVVETERKLEETGVEVGTLRSDSGSIPAGAVDVRVVLPFFRRITYWPGTLNWVLVHDPGLIAIEDKPQPVALEKDSWAAKKAFVKTMCFTREPVDTETLQPADINKRQQFWLTVHVPDDAAAGVYKAPIKIVPRNAAARELTLEVTVPSFDLLAPKFEYSVYYAVNDINNEEQYLSELRNMAAHGCMNPNISDVRPTKKDDGTLDFSKLEKTIQLREKAGIRGVALYLVIGVPHDYGNLTAEMREENVRWVREIVSWAAKRGYPEVYFYGRDEAAGDDLTAQREAWMCVHEGGGKMFVANETGDFFKLVGDLLDLPILLHPLHAKLLRITQDGTEADPYLDYPENVREAMSPALLLAEYYQEIIRGVHAKGFKIFTYMDMHSGNTFPDSQRRHRGLGLWKTGLDGTMTWAYNHNNAVYTEPGDLNWEHWNDLYSFVIRCKKGPIDTLSWEGYREGYDDGRYLATLEAALKRSKEAGKHSELVAETEKWLEGVSVDVALDSWRRETARRTELLLKP